jgi:hypothetical protein
LTDITTIAQDFTDFLNEWHSFSEPYDSKLDAWLFDLYAKEKCAYRKLDWSAPYFSPSSAGKDDRELYVKALRMPKDDDPVKPWQRRYTARGTAVGDWLQRELLLSERHYEKFTGKAPRFTIARTDDGKPFFEDFVHGQRFFEHNGQRFSILGTCDGVLIDHATGKRIGLEIKSKQQSYADTGYTKMKGPKDDHVKQVTCYGLMYDIDAYLIVYVNCSVKSWFMSDEEFAKSPDIRVFGVDITDVMKTSILDKFAGVTFAVSTNTPPPLDLFNFRFNNFKRSCAVSLSDDEFEVVKRQVRSAQSGNLPDWRKRALVDAFHTIKEYREGDITA